MSYETKQSRLVFDYLKENSSNHFSAEDIYFGIVKKGGKIGKTTVYRQLDRLCDKGIVRKLFSGDNDGFCYQYINGERCSNHYHLKCSVCGKLFHFECDFLDKAAYHILDEHNFMVDTSKIVFYGICEQCAKRTEDNK